MMVSKLCFFTSTQKIFPTGSDPKPIKRKSNCKLVNVKHVLL